MSRNALNFQHGRIGAERFKFNFARRRSVQRVPTDGAELGEVEFGDAASDFFVRIKAQSNGAMGDFGMLLQMAHGAHDNGDAGFII